MTTEVSTPKKYVKLGFFAAYAISVALILFLVSWLRNDAEATTVTTAPPVANNGSSSKNVMQVDDLLHAKMEALNNLYAGNVTQPVVTDAAKQNILESEKSFSGVLDSLEKTTAAMNGAEEKQKIETLLASFKNNFSSKSNLYASYVQLKESASVNNKEDAGELLRLRSLIAEKDKTIASIQSAQGNSSNEKDRTIASLQLQLKTAGEDKAKTISSIQQQQKNAIADKDRTIATLQSQLSKSKPVVTTATSSDGEWKQKHTQLKSQYSKLEDQFGQLKRSYNNLIEDNKRLIGQIASKKQ